MDNHHLPEDTFTQYLSKVKVLKKLGPKKVKLIASYCQQHYSPSRESLIRHSSKDKNVFFLLKGRLRATITSAKGREIGYKEIRAGEMFGELSAIDNKPRSISVVAIDSSYTAMLEQNHFLDLLEKDNEFCMAVMKHITKMVRDVSEKVFEFGTMNIQERVYIELLRMAQPYLKNNAQVEIQPVPTHTQISNMIGANREAVTREINILKNSGLIELHKNRILLITDIKKLEKIVSDIVDR